MVRSLTRHDNGPISEHHQRAWPYSWIGPLSNIKSGKYPESIVSATEAVKLDPNSEIAYNNITLPTARCRCGMTRSGTAAKALRIRPDFALAQNNLAWFMKARARCYDPIVDACQRGC